MPTTVAQPLVRVLGKSGDDVRELRIGVAGDPKPLRPELVEQLHDRLTELDRERPAVVRVSAEPGPFCAGLYYGDIEDIDEAQLVHRLLRIGLLLDRLYAANYLTVAQLEGPAVGAGADLAVACDIRVATAEASLRFPGPRFGLILGSARLASVTDSATALRAATGATISAEEALRRGLVTDLVAPAEVAGVVERATESHLRISPLARGVALTTCRPKIGTVAMADLARSIAEPGLLSRVRSVLGI